MRKGPKQSPRAPEIVFLCCNPFLKTQKNRIARIGFFPSEIVDWKGSRFFSTRWQASVFIKGKCLLGHSILGSDVYATSQHKYQIISSHAIM